MSKGIHDGGGEKVALGMSLSSKYIDICHADCKQILAHLFTQDQASLKGMS